MPKRRFIESDEPSQDQLAPINNNSMQTVNVEPVDPSHAQITKLEEDLKVAQTATEDKKRLIQILLDTNKRLSLQVQGSDDFINKAEALLTCEICTDLLFQPFVLKCGHCYCYGCLEDWFKTARTCPMCRTKIRDMPYSMKLIKDMTEAFVTRIQSKDVDPKYHDVKKRQMLAKSSLPTNDSSYFGGRFARNDHRPFNQSVDVEDGVMRCANCHWEVEDNRCLHCGLAFTEDGSIAESDEGSGIISHSLTSYENRSISSNASSDENRSPVFWDGNWRTPPRRHGADDDQNAAAAWHTPPHRANPGHRVRILPSSSSPEQNDWAELQGLSRAELESEDRPRSLRRVDLQAFDDDDEGTRRRFPSGHNGWPDNVDNSPVRTPYSNGSDDSEMVWPGCITNDIDIDDDGNIIEDEAEEDDDDEEDDDEEDDEEEDEEDDEDDDNEDDVDDESSSHSHSSSEALHEASAPFQSDDPFATFDSDPSRSSQDSSSDADDSSSEHSSDDRDEDEDDTSIPSPACKGEGGSSHSSRKGRIRIASVSEEDDDDLGHGVVLDEAEQSSQTWLV